MPSGFVCSVIDVPADRHDPSAGTIPIRILARPHTSNSEPEREPLFATPGGPGSPGIENYAMWLLPGMIGDHRDVVAINAHGTGPLGAIDCPDLQDGSASYEAWAAAVDACGAQLGDSADDYGPVDRALDVEAVREALGYDQIVYHGQSFASVDVQAYAARFPERLKAVVLDSGTAVNDLDGTLFGVGVAGGLLDVVAAECAQHARCRDTTTVPRAAVSTLVETLGAPGADVDAASIISLIDDADADPSADLVPAAVAYAAGDHEPLLKLVATNPPSNDGDGDPATSRVVTTSPGRATTGPFRTTSRIPSMCAAGRSATTSTSSPRVFAPWTKEQWTAFYYAPYVCVGWPVPGHHEAVLPAGMTFPEIPALILAGQLEPTVSLSEKLLDVFPNGECYVVPGPITPPCRSGCAPPSSRPTGSTEPNPQRPVPDGSASRVVPPQTAKCEQRVRKSLLPAFPPPPSPPSPPPHA